MWQSPRFYLVSAWVFGLITVGILTDAVRVAGTDPDATAAQLLFPLPVIAAWWLLTLYCIGEYRHYRDKARAKTEQ